MKSETNSFAKAKQCRNIGQFKQIWSLIKRSWKAKKYNYWNFESTYIVESKVKISNL